MNYKKYQNARNASWELLLDLQIKELPVKITSILKELKIPIYKYESSREFIKENQLEALIKKSDGFTLLLNEKHYIFYDEKKTPQRIRFTLAHELGHIVCNHLFEKTQTGLFLTMRNTEPICRERPEERQANIFASRLLAPACVLHELGINTVQQIVETCQISQQSASFRLERIATLEKRNKDYLKQKGYSCFYLSPLEKKLYMQFEEYIRRNKL